MSSPGFTVSHMIRVVLALGWADFVLKYRGSFLGYLWSFVLPLTKFLVIYHIFRNFTQGVENYALYLFLGIILWEHFAMTTSACIALPSEKSGIIKQMRFPRILLMFSLGWTHVIILCTYLLIFILLTARSGVALLPGLFFLPLLILQATLIALGLGMILSSYALKYRDIAHLWAVSLQVLFWLTPIMYDYRPSAPVFEDLRALFAGRAFSSLWSIFDAFIRLQPLSILLHDARRILLYPTTLGIPTAIHIIGFTVACALVFVAGAAIFHRRSSYFIQEY